MKSFISSIALVSLTAMYVSSASAEPVKAGDLMIDHAWSRATPGGAKVGGGYLTIENKGAAPDKLLGGTSAIAGKVEVHEMSMNNGVMTMRPVSGGLSIPAGKSVALSPGGYHLMIMGLKAPFKQGDKVPVTLQFEKAGNVDVTFDVQGIGAQGPSGADNAPATTPMKMNPASKM